MTTVLTRRLRTLDAKLILGISVFLSEVLSGLMSLILKGKVDRDFLIAAGVVSLAVSAIFVYLLKQVGRLASDIERLESETAARKQADKELGESEELLRLTTNAANAGSWKVNLATGEFIASDKAMELHGLPPNASMNHAVALACVHPDDRGTVEAALQRAGSTGETVQMEHRVLLPDGTVRWVFSHAVRRSESGQTWLIGLVQDITRRKIAEEELRLSEELLRRLSDNASVGLTRCSRDWFYVYANPAYAEIAGKPLAQIVGHPIAEVMGAAAVETIRPYVERVLRGDYVTYEAQVPFAAGGQRYLHVSYTPDTDAVGQIVGWVASVTDITERKKAEEALLRSQELLAQAQKMGKVGGWEINIDTLEQIWTEEVYRIHEVGPDYKPTVENGIQFYAPESRQVIQEAVQNAIETGAPFDVELAFLTAKGNRRWVKAVGQADLERRCVRGFFQDITDRKNAEEEMTTLMKEQQIIFDNSNVSIWKMVDRKAVWVNQKTVELFQYPTEELLGQSTQKLYPSQEAYEKLGREAYPVLAQGSAFVTEQPLIRRDGVGIWVRYNGKAIEPPDLAKGVIWVLEDITERKAVEEKIKQSEQFIRSILNSVDEGFIVVDRDYRIQIANRAYCQQLPFPCDQIIGKSCFAVSHGHGRPCHEEGEECAVKKVFEDGMPHTVFHKHTGPDNTVLFVESKAFPLIDDSGNLTSAIEVITNITEKHLLEEERLKTQKLEAVGTLAGGIAHDFNNLLQGVFGYISLARLKKNDPEGCIALLEEAEKALHMTTKLTNQLLTFSKGGMPIKKTNDIRGVVDSASRFALSGSRSDVRITSGADLWKTEVDEGQISQVIQNVVLNADQAMPDTGVVDIALWNVESPGSDLPLELAAGKYIAISISDTGIGIPEKYIHRIFDPYFTTKDKGSGLGLATSYSIVRNHNGMIDVTSEPGRGTTFRIYLPAIILDEVDRQPRTSFLSELKKGRILVMDDEQFILNIAGEMLKAQGHEVDVAANGTEALQKWKEARDQGRPFDIAILDLTIRGGMGGEETLRRLRDIDPSVKAVVSSGYSDDATIAAYTERGFKAALKKPYNMAQLREVLSRLLNE